ncbi:MAG: cytochrome c biogenesis protein CcdA [Planctomycetota bacterium]
MRSQIALRWYALLLTTIGAVTGAARAQDFGFGDFGGGLDGFGGGFGGGFGDEAGDPVSLSAQFTAATDDRPAVLMITADIQPGWHVYSVTQPPGGPMRTNIAVTPSDGFRVIGGFAALPKPETHFDDEAFKMNVEEHADRVTWYVPIVFSPGVDAASATVSGEVKLQACKTQCVPMTIAFEAKLGTGVEIGPLNTAPNENATGDGSSGAATLPPVAPVETASAAAPTTRESGEAYDLAAIEFGDLDQSESLLFYLAVAFGGGLLLNLMPCVLPVIGLKVMSFVDQAGKSRGHALTLNVWYSLGILSVFVALALLAIGAGLSWGEQFGSPTFNVVMASIIFVMALSLLGVWEIPIPGFLGSGKAAEAASKEGASGAFLKGVVTTLLATPCIGPGMGAALGWAVKQPPGVTLAVFASLGIGMASPYLLIGVFPNTVRFLPKPGAWMETFKELMGFVLLGTVLFLLAILPTHDLLPTLALFTALALACWTFGKTPLTASSGEKNQTYALCSAITVGGAVFAFGWLAPLLSAEDDPSWRPFSLPALKQVAVDGGKTVLVDFSADWCANCKVLEKAVLHTEAVEKAVHQNGVVTMYADNTKFPPEIESTLRALGANGVPVIAIFPGGDPYRPIVFRDGYTQNGLIEAIEKAAAQSPLGSVTARPGPKTLN